MEAYCLKFHKIEHWLRMLASTAGNCVEAVARAASASRDTNSFIGYQLCHPAIFVRWLEVNLDPWQRNKYSLVFSDK